MLLWRTHTTGVRFTELVLLEISDVLYPRGTRGPVARSAPMGVLDINEYQGFRPSSKLA